MSEMVSWLAVFIRGVLCVRLAISGVPVVALFALSEGFALCMTVSGLLFGRVDREWSSSFVPVAYCVPVMVNVSVGLPVNVTWLVLVLILCQWGTRFALGRSLSVGVPVFVRLRDVGPWRFVRHPLALIEVILTLAIGLGAGGGWNLFVCVLAVWSMALAVALEERFLFEFPCYENYASRVRWRWIPGLW